MRTLTSATADAVAGALTQPGYLVQIDWSVPVYLCSRDDTEWAGRLWVGAPLEVRGLTWTGAAEQKGVVAIGNADGSVGIVALREGAADVRIQIWIFDAAALADDDPVPVFDGSGDACEIERKEVRINITSRRSRALFAPRTYITAANGFSIIPTEGRTLPWGGERYVFKRAR